MAETPRATTSSGFSEQRNALLSRGEEAKPLKKFKHIMEGIQEEDGVYTAAAANNKKEKGRETTAKNYLAGSNLVRNKSSQRKVLVKNSAGSRSVSVLQRPQTYSDVVE